MLNKIISLMAECLEREPETIQASDLFRKYDEWDSLAYLSVIAQIDDDFGIVVPIEDFKACRTIQDLASYVDKHKA
jgi:acyl carrier protein